MTETENRRIPTDVAEAVTVLFRAVYRDVLASTILLAGRTNAADLVQHAFHEAALQWDEVGTRPLDGQKAWLRTVCRNKHIDGLRRDATFNKIRIDVCEFYTTAPHDPADVIVARTALDRCWTAIQAMPPAQRDAVPAPSEAFVQEELDKLVAWMSTPARPAVTPPVVPPPAQDIRFLNIAEAAALLHVPKLTVDRLVPSEATRSLAPVSR
ncbi:RNA polymerase sigma factor [Kitasatospora sp. NPDC058063]|uniref:RNA polymerase sigma factor n=1 Tax=unclassified Kitasatospora TaxID=2633591 RepID=UPI0036D960A2